jgi:hypothetical protein
MGVIRWLDRIDPAVWNVAVQRMTRPPASKDEALEFLAAFAKAPDDELAERLEESEPRSLPSQSVLNKLFERAVTDESWYLDKSLGRFERLPHHLPALKPLLLICSFSGISINLPRACGPDDSGLFGCLSPTAVAESLQAVERFSSLSEVCAALRAERPSFFRRVLGSAGDPRALAADLEEAHVDSEWEDLRAALQETAARAHYLGLGMNT